MNKKTIKLTALTLSATLLFGIGSVWAKNSDQSQKADNKPLTVTSNASSANTKDETVYVLSTADGSAKQVIVSSWLKNTEKADTLADCADLHDIENVKGDEAFTAGKGSALTWDAAGKDIYYQGISDQKAPVDLKISYTLDGVSITPENLAGKSGHVTIRFDYQNNRFENVKINGKQEKIYVPFIMLSGVMLDTDSFSNVTVTNGKLENLGEEMIVLGAAMPGMQENLNLNRDDISIPDYWELSADVESFSMGPTLTLATTSLFNEFSSDDINIKELTDQVKKLTDGMTQLSDGSNKLYDGLSTLLDQAEILVSGINQLASGATELQAGANALSGGASRLQSGAAQLSEGLSTLDSNSSALNGGAEQVFNSLLSAANTQLASAGLSVSELTIGNYADVLGGVIASLDENAVYQSALQQVTAGVEAKRGEITAAVTEVVRQQVSAQVTEKVNDTVRETVTQAVKAEEAKFQAAVIHQATGMTPEEYQAAVEAGLVTSEQQAAIAAAVEAAMTAEIEKNMKSPEIQAKITALIEQKTAETMASDEIAGKIAENTELQVQKAISDTMASPEIQQKLQAAAEGAKAVIALKSSLDSYNGFYLGLQAYTSGVSAATSGAKDLIAGADTLKNGMNSLNSGVGSLNSGIQTMKEKSPALLNGISALKDGSKALKDGLAKVMEEGIQKIADLAEEDLTDLTARLSATVDAANSYTSFSGLDTNMDGTVKFIYKTDSIEKKDS